MNFVEMYPGAFVLIAAISSNFLAQFIKYIAYRIQMKKWDLSILFTTGGMPSSHTAFVISGLIAVGITSGVFSSVFAVMFILTSVVIHDATGVRRHAGKQAAVLNHMVQDFLELTTLLQKGGLFENIAYDKKLKEFLGHEPIEVFAGVAFGSVITVITYFLLIQL
ncbi:MAG: divergent PAP2 family protein [Culicoidibacterales bacterium]